MVGGRIIISVGYAKFPVRIPEPVLFLPEFEHYGRPHQHGHIRGVLTQADSHHEVYGHAGWDDIRGADIK